ncbi:MAG: plasmid mobilization protein [Acidimicrobiales bacterium]
MTEPGLDARDSELADYYEQHREDHQWGEPEPVQRPDRLEVTISVRFTRHEVAAVRARAEAAGLKPTAYIRRCALEVEEPPIDRGKLSQSVTALSRDLEELRRTAG